MAERVWTVKGALDWTVGYLGRGDVDSPRLSAEWLLSAATGLSRVELYAYHDRPLSDDERTTLRETVKRRAAGEPLQYVTGEMPFRHIVVHVRPGVFIPRPETEVLVDVGLMALEGVVNPVILDLCTGSGCVACAIASEIPSAMVYATELSRVSVDTARKNAVRLGVGERVTVVEGDLFTGLPDELQGRVDLVISNPPYIPSSDLPDLTADVLGFEPHLALDGGADGLDVARRIMSGGVEWLAPGGAIALELDEGCVGSGCAGAKEWYQEVRVMRDLAGRDRIVTGRRP